MTQLPDKIGQYQIRRLIGTGGMGSVYEGVQQNPRRSVAIKVINAKVHNKEAASRLLFEAQLLARLHHPGIAEIYEAGTYTVDGDELPYFAMEYIPNPKSITSYANEKELGTREKLELFAEVCDAVHHGHQRSIIHRDLKPANILVDSGGRIRVIDFGIARATDSDLKQTAMQTEVGQLVGSAAYMSPEQFEADPHDIDIRSDVYTLGVVLYELLSGAMPYDAKSKSIFEVALLIKDERPPLMGTIDPSLKGELEIIVDKALQKDRDQRYESAHGLAADIRRFLSGAAIAAKPPSFGYQFQVFARRNRAVVGLAAVVLVLLVAGISATSWLYLSVSEERARAEAEGQSAMRARDFLTGAIRSFAPPGFDPLPGVGEMCDKAAAELDGAFPGSPETEADVRMALAEAYWRLLRIGEAELHFSKAIDLRTASLGVDHSKTLKSMRRLRRLYSVHAMHAKMLELSREILQICESSFGPSDDRTMNARFYLVYAHEMADGAAIAALKAEELIQYCQLTYGADHENTADVKQNYAWLLMQAGRLDESLSQARSSYERAERIYPKESDGWVVAQEVLAAALLASGKQEEAKELYGHKKLPDVVDVEHTFQGSYTPHDSDITILVFWETWCPYSQRTVPKLDQVYRQYKEFGVDVVGITRVSRSATNESVQDFIREKNLTIPIVKETGRMWDYFGATGTPFVCVTHDDELVWKGTVSSPEEFSKRIIEGMLGGQ